MPLSEVLAEILGGGAGTKSVRQKYDELVRPFGPELFIVEHAPPEDLARAGFALLSEAVSRMRQGRVIRQPGFDGQYGTIRLFGKDKQRTLF